MGSGLATPCMFFHAARDIRVVVHGDDFTVLGRSDNLDWFRQRISSHFEVKFRGRLGPEGADDKAIRILNRVVTWTCDGSEHEADQRHAEIILQHLGLSDSSKAVGTPSIRTNKEDDEPLEKTHATMYRALVARANSMAQDRADIGFAVKELCRHMANPRKSDFDKRKRLGRYLIDKSRVVAYFAYQEQPEALDVYVDRSWWMSGNSQIYQWWSCYARYALLESMV